MPCPRMKLVASYTMATGGCWQTLNRAPALRRPQRERRSLPAPTSGWLSEFCFRLFGLLAQAFIRSPPHPRRPASINRTVDPRKVTGSAADTFQHMLCVTRLSTMAQRIPATSPTDITRKLWPSIMETTSRGCPPKAIRMPISRKRDRTKTNITL